jgi:uncharacterized protein YcbX
VKISALYRYPIKSLGGEQLDAAQITPRGIAGDRRWMFVDRSGKFISRRTHPQLARFTARLYGEAGLELVYHHTGDVILRTPSARPTQGTRLPVTIFDDSVPALEVSFPRPLLEGMGIPSARLVYMDEESRRPVDPRYAGDDEVVSFADGYPYLVLGEATIAELAERMQQTITAERFRPNIVVAGAAAGAEDDWQSVQLGEAVFRLVKPCSRCIMVDQDPHTGTRDRAVLGELSRYRKVNHKLLFGMNALADKTAGTLNVGDPVTVLRPA